MPVTAGLLQPVNQTPPLASFRTAASTSLLRLEMQYATYPERPGPPRKARRVTHTHTHRPACARTHTFTPALGHSAHTHTLYTSQESSGCEVDGFVASGVGGLQEFHNKRRFRRFLSPGSEHHTQTPDFLFGEYQRDAGALCVGARQTARGKTLQTVV